MDEKEEKDEKDEKSLPQLVSICDPWKAENWTHLKGLTKGELVVARCFISSKINRENL